MADVAIKELIKSYDKKQNILDHINLEIKDGELMVFVGPSGCGKSTLLRTIAGLESITDGEISISGRRVNNLPPQQRNIAMVFQNYALYPHMSVRDNMSFPLRMQKMPVQDITRQVETVAEQLDITPLLHKKPKQLSGGSGSGWLWAGLWCGSRRFFSWMNRSPTWMPSSGCKSAARSPRFNVSSG